MSSGEQKNGDDAGRVRSLVIPGGTIARIRHEKEFIALLNLGRMVNTLQFALTVLRQTPGVDTPADTRQGVNAFLLCGSLLFEGIRHVNVLAAKYPSFDHIGRFKKPYEEIMLAEFEETVLKIVRNQIVSHFDDEVFEESLAHGEFGDVLFAQCHSANLDDMVFTLADELVLGYVTNSYTGSWSPSHRDFLGLIETMILLSREFTGMVVELITVVLADKGWVEA
jgi:hypothetical protein